MQAVLFIFFSEEVLRKNDSWNLIFKHFETSLDLFFKWRSRANIKEEFRLIPNFFSKIGALSFILMFVIFFFKIENQFIFAFLLSIILFSIVTVFSFNWVFKHKDALKELKPIVYFYGFVLIIIAINAYLNPIYPDSLLEISKNYNILLPSRLESLLSIAYFFLIMLLGYYLITWGFALVIPSSILLILFTTSKISIFINKYIDKKVMIGIMSIIQLLVFYGFYLNS